MKLKTVITTLATILVITIVSPGQSPRLQPQQARPDAPLFTFENGGLYGYTDARGTVVIEPQFNSAFDFSEDLARVQMCSGHGFRWGFINSDGQDNCPSQIRRRSGLFRRFSGREHRWLMGFYRRERHGGDSASVLSRRCPHLQILRRIRSCEG